MADLVTEPPDALLADQENLGYARSPKSKGLQGERIKHKAVRPSARLARMNMVADVMTDGDSLAVTTKGPTGLKKYAKNSRRPRGRYGRGLPKKGSYSNRAHWPQKLPRKLVTRALYPVHSLSSSLCHFLFILLLPHPSWSCV